MSIKKLFDSTNKGRNYLSETDDKNAFSEVESSRNVRAITKKQDHLTPQIDFSEPENFAKYGSAYLYYKSAIEHVYGYYPYDGSDAEITEYYNNLLGIEKYIYNNLYPKTAILTYRPAAGGPAPVPLAPAMECRQLQNILNSPEGPTPLLIRN